MSARTGKNIFKWNCLVASVLMTLAVTGCTGRPPRQEESAPKQVEEVAPERGFDPLGLAQDTVPVSTMLERDTAEHGNFVKPSNIFPGGEAVWTKGSRSDSLGRQVFRVQLVMVETYSEARRALAVAQEIFDQPVTLDYEVPYYKLRVGEFATRREAEAYQQKARGAGYPNSWVMLSTTSVKQIEPMYELRDSTAADTSGHGH